MQELLLFMYSGRVQNLAHMALDLLAAADRFQLPGLKEMADQVLRLNLGTDSVCRILVFADMHNARELKQDAIRFIAQNSSQVIQVCASFCINLWYYTWKSSFSKILGLDYGLG